MLHGQLEKGAQHRNKKQVSAPQQRVLVVLPRLADKLRCQMVKRILECSRDDLV